MNKVNWIVLWIFIGLANSAVATQFELPGDDSDIGGKGRSVSIEGRYAAVGAPFDTFAGLNSGLVYLYEKDDDQWQLIKTLVADDRRNSELFGYRVELFQQRLFVSADSANKIVDGVELIDTGAVYVFEQVAGEWQQTAKIEATEIASEDHFGETLATDVNRIVITKGQFAARVDEPVGSVHVYDYVDGDWVETSSFVNDQLIFDRFSRLGLLGAEIDGDVLMVTLSANNDITRYGILNIYNYADGEWQLTQSINSPLGSSDDFFAGSISLRRDRLLIGDTNENNNNGAVYMYEKDTTGTWVLVQRFASDNDAAFTQYGIDVAMGVDQFFVGSRHANNQGPSGITAGEGQVFMYNLVDGIWQLSDTLEADGDQGHNDFGQSLDLDHDQLLIGAPGRSIPGNAYVFETTPNGVLLPINEGLNGTWFNQDTSGQGLFLDLNPTTGFSFLGWFTYDTQPSVDDQVGQIGAEGQRWLVGAGEIDQNNGSIYYDLYYTYDGLFDDPRQVTLSDIDAYGKLNIRFNSCSTAQVSYQFFGQQLSDSFPVSRPVAGSDSLCKDLDTAAILPPADNQFDYRLNGAWFNPATPGQGFFIDNFKGADAAFMGWFTYDTELPTATDNSVIGATGQRWLVGAGVEDETDHNVLNYQLYYTYGGLFDDPMDVTTTEVGNYGNLRIEFVDCAHANVEYNIDGEALAGAFTMNRAVPNSNSCDLTVE